MRRLTSYIFVLALLGGLLLPAEALAGDNAEDPRVSIVEPAFRSPQEWAYTPNDLTVAVGTTINWTNTGAVVHTVTADDGVSFDSGSLDPQTTFSFSPDSPGTFSYHCSFHPWMTGRVTAQ